MKKAICLLLASVLLCISIAGCSASGAGESGTLSTPSSQSTPTSQSSASLQSSSQTSSSAPSSSTSSQQEEQWVSPTGSFPYTSKALYEYYEENPELKEYYYKYIVPYGYLNGVSSWEDASDIPISAIWVWTWQELTQEEKNALPKHPVSLGNMLPVSLVEEKMQPYFDLDMQALIDKNQMGYLSEYNVFYIPTGSVPFCNWVDAIVDAKQEGDILTLTIRHVPEYNFPEGDWVWTDDPSYSQERDYEMCIRLLDDGMFRYLCYLKIA